VKDLSRKFAAFNLFDRRASIGIPENVRKWFEDGIAFLKDVAKGTASIDGAIEPTSNPKTTGGSFNANDRIFGKDSLDSL
jgi:phage gp36-like protein